MSKKSPLKLKIKSWKSTKHKLRFPLSDTMAIFTCSHYMDTCSKHGILHFLKSQSTSFIFNFPKQYIQHTFKYNKYPHFHMAHRRSIRHKIFLPRLCFTLAQLLKGWVIIDIFTRDNRGRQRYQRYLGLRYLDLPEIFGEKFGSLTDVDIVDCLAQL